MANSAIKPAGDWNLDEILADVRRMRGETSSPSGKNAPDRVEQILAELRAQPLGSAIRSNSTIQHTAAKHTAMSPLTTSRTSVAQDDIAPAQRPRQAAVSPPEDQSVNRRPSEKNEHISVPNQVVSSNSAKRGASVKTLSSTTAPDRSRPSRNNSEKSAAPVPKHRITPDEILHDMPSAASVQGKRRPNTIFEEIKRQAAKEQKRKPVSEPDVIYRKKVSQATAVSKSALEHTNDPVDSAPTRIDIPLASSPSRQERTRVLSPDQDSLSRPADVFTGQVPLPGFDESPSISKEQDDVWEKQLREARSKRVQNFVLSGQEEDNEPEENPEVTDDMVAIDDYESIDDAPVIRMDLMARRRSVGLRLGITLLIEAILLLLSAHTLFFSDFFSSVLTMPIKLILNAVLTALVVLINASTVFGGLGGLFRLNVDLDTGAAVSMLAALLHNVIMLCVTDAFVASGLYVYNAAAVLALVCNLWGKWSMISRIEHNFELVGNENPKKAAVLLENSKEAEEIGHGISIGESLVCCDRDTVTIARYLDHSYVQDPADESAQKLAPYILAAGLVGAVLAFFTASDSSLALIYAITAFSAVSCICVPIASLLAGNLPLGRACRRLRQKGVLITGYDAVYDFAYTNVLAVKARDLFPKGTVSLHQLKTFGNQSIDQALLDAAGLAIMADGPLASIFDEIIEGQHSILPEVDTLVYEEKMGISGWVSGNRVLIGNRLLMKNHGVALPDENLERRLCQYGQHAVYLATRGSLSAMFVVSYRADEAIVEALQNAVDGGLGIAVHSCDPNITPELIDQLFGVSQHAVSIMGAAGRHAYQAASAVEDKCDASLAHMGGVENLTDGVCTCQKLHRSIRLGKGIQLTLWVLGLVLSLLLIFIKGLSLLSVGAVLAFQAISILLILLLPAFFRNV